MRKKKILFSALSAILFLITYLFLPGILTVSRVECESQYGKCRSSLADELEKIKGSSLKEAKIITSDIARNDPYISEYNVSYQIKSGLVLKLSISERKPAYALKKDGEYFLVDWQGYVLEKKGEASIPFAETDAGNLEINKKVDEGVLFPLRIYYEINSVYKTRKAKIETEKGLFLTMAEGYNVIFPLQGDIDYLLGSMELIIRQLKNSQKNSKIENIELAGKTVDLRYKNPVIK